MHLNLLHQSLKCSVTHLKAGNFKPILWTYDSEIFLLCFTSSFALHCVFTLELKKIHCCIHITGTTDNVVLWGFPGGSGSKECAGNAGDLGSTPGSGRSPKKGMATRSIILAWEILLTEEPGRLQFMQLQTVRHDWV